MMMNDLHYVVKAIQLYHPAGKREIRLVYRVFSKEHEGFSTRHQKSYSMTKFGEAAAWEKARESFEYIEKTGEFPPDIELPPGALVPSSNSRYGKKVRASASAARVASAQAAMDIGSRAATAEDRSRQFLPPHLGGSNVPTMQGGNLDGMYLNLPIPNSMTHPDMRAECPDHYRLLLGSSGPYKNPPQFPSSELECSRSLDMKFLSLMQQGSLPVPEDLMFAQQAMMQHHQDIFRGDIDPTKELGVWGSPPPYCMKMVNYDQNYDDPNINEDYNMYDMNQATQLPTWAPVPYPQTYFNNRIAHYSEAPRVIGSGMGGGMGVGMGAGMGGGMGGLGMGLPMEGIHDCRCPAITPGFRGSLASTAPTEQGTPNNLSGGPNHSLTTTVNVNK